MTPRWARLLFAGQATLFYRVALLDRVCIEQWTTYDGAEDSGLHQLTFLAEIDPVALGSGGSKIRQRGRLWCTSTLEPVRYSLESREGRLVLQFAAETVDVLLQDGSHQQVDRGGAAFLVDGNFPATMALIYAALVGGAEPLPADQLQLKLFMIQTLVAVPYETSPAEHMAAVSGRWHHTSHRSDVLLDGKGVLLAARLPDAGINVTLLRPGPPLPEWPSQLFPDAAPLAYHPPKAAGFQLEDVEIAGPVTPIGGTMSIPPPGGGPFPAVLFISGSGTHDRHGIAGEFDIGSHEVMDDLSRDLRLGQRIAHALAVEVGDCRMDGLVKCGCVSEGLVREVIGLEMVPNYFDVVEFGRVFGQPLDGEPVRASGQSGERALAGMDRAIVLDQHDRLGLPPGLGAVESVELLEMGDEVATALGRAGMDDEFARDVIERSQDRYLLGLSRCRHAQVRTRLRPYPGEIGMRQRLALVAKEENNVACLGLLLAQLQAQADPFHLACCLTSLQRVPGPPPTELFFRNALDSCARLMLRPSRASISARRRGIVQLGRSATGSCSNGVTTRKAVALFTAGGPAATLARSASTPPAAKSLRHRRTVSSRTPNASAILGLVQPASVSSTARARSASPRSREPARTPSAARCSSLAVTGDLPAMPHTRESVSPLNCKTYPLVNQAEFA